PPKCRPVRVELDVGGRIRAEHGRIFSFHLQNLTPEEIHGKRNLNSRSPSPILILPFYSPSNWRDGHYERPRRLISDVFLSLKRSRRRHEAKTIQIGRTPHRQIRQ